MYVVILGYSTLSNVSGNKKKPMTSRNRKHTYYSGTKVYEIVFHDAAIQYLPLMLTKEMSIM